MINYNEKQLKCIKHPPAPLMIIAGAGTGKTATIIGRICHLIIEEQIEAENILALTFTVKAANNLKKRIVDIIGTQGEKVYISNFHSFALDLILDNYSELGYKSKPSTIEANESKYLINQLINQNSSVFRSSEYRKRNLKALQGVEKIFNQISNELISIDALEKLEYELSNSDSIAEEDHQRLDAINLFFMYKKIKQENSWIDFGDMILGLSELLKDPSILLSIRRKFKHLIVDEFQDNNYALSRILERISGKGGSVTVVGDDDQSIYSFRGAHAYGFNEFREFHKASSDYAEITLDINYRSTQSILDFAHEIVKENSPRFKNTALQSSSNIEGEVVLYSGNKIDQKSKVITLVKEIIKDGYSPEDICVLTRTRGNAVELKDMFESNGISTISSAEKLFELRVAKDFISFVNIIYKGKHFEIGLYRLLTHSDYKERLEEPGIISEVIDLFNSDIESKHVPYEIVNYLYSLSKTVKKTENLLDSFNLFLSKFSRSSDDLDCLKILQDIILKYTGSYKVSGDGDICSYLNSLFDLNDTFIDLREETDKISIMTVHQSKGMEFDVVLIPFLSSNVFPLSNKKTKYADSLELDKKEECDNNLDQHINEERRIFHVATTRAKEKLFLFAPESRRSSFFKSIEVDTYIEKEIIESDQFHEQSFQVDFKYNKAPVSFSSTSLALYDSCPLAYKYSFVDRIKSHGYTPESLLGIYLHKALELIYLNKYSKDDDIIEVIDQAWEQERFIDLVQSNQFKNEAIEILLDYIHSNDLNFTKDFKLEYELKLEINGNVFMGKIDRLDIDENNTFSIVDYKTSKKKKTATKARKDIQLLYYSLLLSENNNISSFPIRSSLVYIRDAQEPSVDLQVSVEDLQEIKERILGLTLKIKSHDYNPKKNSLCFFCDYKRLLCPLYK